MTVTRVRSMSAAAAALLALLASACSDTTGPQDPGNPGGGAVARIEIDPGAVLLTASGQVMQLKATAYDASGATTTAEIVWQSSAPGAVSVSTDGVATAVTGLGSAQITAQAQGITSPPVLAIVGQPTAGTVLIPDSMILSDLIPVDANADYGPGWQYRIRVASTSGAESGRLVVGTGGRPLAGRIVTAAPQGSETELTVELVSLAELFIDLMIDAEIPLVEVEPAPGGNQVRMGNRSGAMNFEQPDTKFTLGKFECTASGKVPDIDLPTPKLTLTQDLRFKFGYANGLKTYAVVGSARADFDYRPVIDVTFEGKVGCEQVLKTVTIPVTGFLSALIGIQVPLGVGFELDGKLEVAKVGFDVSAEAEASVELGLICPAGGQCTGATTFDAQRDFQFEFIAPKPDEQFKVELGAHGFLFAKPALGSAFSSAAQFEFLEAKAGLKQSVDLAAAKRQVIDTSYRSGFKLAGLVSVGPGQSVTDAIDKLGKLLGQDLDLDLTVVDIDEPLAESPKGTFTITPGSVAPGDGITPGDPATFTIDLDPVTFLGFESVESVEIFWKKDDGAGGFTLESARPGCTLITGSMGQKKFECTATFLQEHLGIQSFHAFVNARMFGFSLPLPVEVADNAVATVNVGGVPVCPVPPAELVPRITADTLYADPTEGTSSVSWAGSYNQGTVDLSVTSTVEGSAWYFATLDVYTWDYLTVVPLNGWPADGSVYVNFRHTGEGTTTRELGYESGGNCFGDDTEVTISFINNHLQSTPACGALEDTTLMDEVTPLTFRHNWDWREVRGAIRASARVGGNQRSASARASLEVTFEGAEDSMGNPVPVLVCSASGTQY